METAASTEAGTLKKKRNRAHKKPKPEGTAVEKENNPPTRTTAAKTAPESVQRPPVIGAGDAAELSRKPSRRRKRKPKGDKKESESELQTITVEELFPPGKIVTHPVGQVRVQQRVDIVPGTVAASRKLTFDTKKYPGIVDIGPRELFPVANEPQTVVQNITFDEIFPGPELFRFDAAGTIPGKLTFAESDTFESTVSKKQPIKRTIEYDQQGLHDISAGDLFPNSLLIGSTEIPQSPATMNVRPPAATAVAPAAKADKTREEVLAEREAKKAAKLAAKNKSKDKEATPAQEKSQQTAKPSGKAKEQRPAKPKADAAAPAELKKSSTDASICEKMKDLHISDGGGPTVEAGEKKELTKAERKALFEAQHPSLAASASADGTKPAKPTLTKAERRAIQEAQRAAKAESQQAKKRDTATTADGKHDPKKASKADNETTTKTKAP
uniref:Uncharacterized protein n=1 Tax=Anopheles maculatus TaxID=74869 RepID=A0A182SHU3_9DIPT